MHALRGDFQLCGEGRHAPCSSLDMPLHMSGSLGTGCQKVSKTLPGRKGGAALLGISPPEASAPVRKDVRTWLFTAASFVIAEVWNPRLQRAGRSTDIPAVEYYTAVKKKGLPSISTLIERAFQKILLSKEKKQGPVSIYSGLHLVQGRLGDGMFVLISLCLRKDWQHK